MFIVRRTITKTVTRKPFFARHASTIGFIGLGNMGSGMAANLISKGHQVIVYDLVADSVLSLQRLGALKASSPREVGERSSKVITMLPTNQHVEEVYAGKDGVLEGAHEGTLLIDSSTVDPDLSVRLADKATQKRLAFVDAPVSGGVNAAQSGSLTFMVGGSEGNVSAARDTLLCMGKKVIHCGPVGCGGAAKLCNNMMLAISMIGHSETMNLGIKMGLDPKVLTDVMNASSGKTWVSEVYSPVPGVMENSPASKGYKGGFGSALMLKDLCLAQAAAARTGSPTPLGSLAQQFYTLLCSKGHSKEDFGRIYKLLTHSDKQ